MKETIKIYSICKREDGEPNAYYLKNAELEAEIKTSFSTYFEDYQKALVEVGCVLMHGSLAMLVDEAWGIVFFHRSPIVHRITRHATLASLNAYLMANFKERLIGKLGGLR